MGPEFARGPNTGLDLINNEEHIVLLGDIAEALEEGRRGVVVTALGLHGFDNDASDGVVEFLDQSLSLRQAALLLLRVLFGMLLQRVLQGGERRLGPVEGGNVQLVDGLAAGSGQTAKETAVESLLERQDRQVRRPRGLVGHGARQVLLGKVDIGTATLKLTAIHECRLVGRLVGVGAGHGSEHLVQALGGSLQDTSLQHAGPLGGGEISQRRPVDQCIGHFRRLGRLEKVGVVISDGDGGNLSIASHAP